MSQELITDEVMARQPPEALGIIHALLEKLADSKTKSSRKRGGQWGHPRHERTLRPSAECDAVVPMNSTIRK